MTQQKLGKNQGCYCGETIPILDLLGQIHEAALTSGWIAQEFYRTEKFVLRGYLRLRPDDEGIVYISSGVHGDEPAGPCAMLRLLKENHWPEKMGVILSPCLNPSGFLANTRTNADGLDLNRDYRHFQSAEVRAHTAWLKTLPPFNLTLLLHEDWEANGFYLYELNPGQRRSYAEIILKAVREICPIETAERVDNWEAKDGIVRPGITPAERVQWPEAFFLITNKSPISYTLEAPSDFPIEVRVAALVRAVHSVLEVFKTNCN